MRSRSVRSGLSRHRDSIAFRSPDLVKDSEESKTVFPLSVLLRDCTQGVLRTVVPEGVVYLFEIAHLSLCGWFCLLLTFAGSTHCRFLVQPSSTAGYWRVSSSDGLGGDDELRTTAPAQVYFWCFWLSIA